jgi:hypothetical protein
VSANRILILLVVVLLVLFGISAAVGHRNHDRGVNPENFWFKDLVSPKRVDPSEITSASGWQAGRWIIPATLGSASLEVKPSRNKSPVRRLRLTLESAGKFEIHFTPAQDSKSNFLDAGAQPVHITSFSSSQSPLELTVLRQGGTLLVKRPPGPAAAVFRVD